MLLKASDQPDMHGFLISISRLVSLHDCYFVFFIVVTLDFHVLLEAVYGKFKKICFQIIDHSLIFFYLLALFDQFASMGITQSDLKVIQIKNSPPMQLNSDHPMTLNCTLFSCQKVSHGLLNIDTPY